MNEEMFRCGMCGEPGETCVCRKVERRECPDGGRCHHDCADDECFRVACCCPLGESDEWPDDVKHFGEKWRERAEKEAEEEPEPPFDPRRELPERIWWCFTCGGVGVWGVDNDRPPPRCPECHGNDFGDVKYVPEKKGATT